MLHKMAGWGIFNVLLLFKDIYLSRYGYSVFAFIILLRLVEYNLLPFTLENYLKAQDHVLTFRLIVITCTTGLHEKD